MSVRTILAQTATATVMEDTLNAAGPSDPVRVRDNIAIQFTGPATAITAVVERSTMDPSLGAANWCRVEDTAITGNPASGMTVMAYSEPAIAWWRVRLIGLTGSNVTVSISGSV